MNSSFPRLSRSLIRGCRSALAETDCSFASSGQGVRVFAEQFTRFEWMYLCSYRWFVTALQSAVYRGNFISVQLRAQQKLENEGLRQNRIASTRASNECESERWWS